MIEIYRLTPKPIKIGSFRYGILKIKGQESIETTKEDVLKRFNRGYYRCGEI